MVKNELFKPLMSDFKKLVKGLVRVFLRIKFKKGGNYEKIKQKTKAINRKFYQG
tara:strand:- start:623 stop:784 length:162 start_codon:yes stop_codon:yes gene_type:complete